MPAAPYACGIDGVVDLIGGKWKIVILHRLTSTDGRLRFSELRKQVGKVSEKMLSQQIKEMVADGLVRRIDYKVVPPHVAYELTAFGKDLCSALYPICDWGERNLGELTAISRARQDRQA
ncbi:helix-turn-helix transcriptional regulator [Phyllobacterium sp. 21LDTY02-6]|jgi:DNA-binding HxlR family transcriptional regulator|uniref:winged helix-turn-helix transcriptional regulator n=1 Tax=unclassified Phyllobacterium TaxID=2638441 RepID=UPI00201FBFCA|nr:MULTISPECIES: helix-turn-helix domain-containing protein [unclassified Phyllobacterium]MCO4316423.1 helix-turn-helix transcriptional regulator [Phyllobacterium sp. 21LDTY02-6]MCX8280775.1 helix-turn-helix domain-containing protein [Phyllobacterium sp. 0TCS1.6C]MCX8292648.1 helix-turn-helix domain-containing protein [Phyllobacterium sp. 0TCS1.6A]